MDRWFGKIALVTGAGSGVGAAVTVKLAEAGVKVFGVDINADGVKDLIKNKIGNVPGDVTPIQCDIKNNQEVIEAFKVVKNKFGAIHILVNAAGIARYGLISDGNVELFKEIFDVNVMGTIYCTQQALKLMKESNVNDGHIIFMNSVAGHYVPTVSCERFNVYSASKHGITALTESLRQELVYLKSKIRVTSISPGRILSNFQASLVTESGLPVEKLLEENLQDLPSLEPIDVANAIIFAIGAPSHVQVHEITLKPVGAKPGS